MPFYGAQCHAVICHSTLCYAVYYYATQPTPCHYAPTNKGATTRESGNMEVLARYGTEAQKDRWLMPLLQVYSLLCSWSYRYSSLLSPVSSYCTDIPMHCAALSYVISSLIRNLTLFPLLPLHSPSILLNSILLYFIPFYSIQFSSIVFSTTLSGRHSQLLRHDRARCGFIGCHQHGEHGGSRGTGSGALGQQVVDLRGNGSEMQGKVQ